MNRRFRLRNTRTFRYVRQFGASYTHPLLILIAAKTGHENSRFGIAVGKKTGTAVQRNRIKRRIRAIITQLLPEIERGWDIILIARKPITRAQFSEITAAVRELLKDAGLSPDQALE